MTNSLFTTSDIARETKRRPNKQEKRPPVSFVLLFVATTIVGAFVVRPFAGVLLLAATLAVTLRPIVLYLSNWFGQKPRLGALAATLAVLLAILLPLGALVAYTANEVHGGLVWAREELGLASWHDLALSSLPPQAEERVLKALDFLRLETGDLQPYMERASAALQTFTPRLFGMSLATLGNLIVALAAFYFFSCDGLRLVDMILRLSPLRRLHTRELMQEFRRVSSASLLGMIFGAVMQSLAVTAGLFLLGVNRVVFFGILSLFAAFVPIIASGLVWIPTVCWLVLTHRYIGATAFAAWCIVMVLTIDNVLKPLVMQGQITMHGGVAFLAIIGGVGLFGPVGVIAGPLVMAFLIALIRIYQRDYLADPQDQRIIQ